ncbi:MAG: haloacid dehalogenase type II [Bryobacterales bacterium]|nr:haloacid dehalogenase type II [Bryobacterales bacterium]
MNRRRAVTLLSAGVASALAGAAGVQALTFDVFGTVVDWRSSVIRDGEKLGKAAKLNVDWAKFADRWRDGYGPAMSRVRKGELPWTSIDNLHRMILDQLLQEFSITSLTEEQKRDLNRVWHRLDPWPDAVKGLTRLKKKFIITTLSNGNLSLLTNMAKYAGLPWDAVLSAELFKHYKPDREVYLGAAAILDLQPAQVMMVAAHPGDLRAAAAAGLRTAYIPRPLERGPGGRMEPVGETKFDVVAKDFVELAAKLGA